MKRLVTLAIMVAFLLGTVGMVKAAELTISGGDMRVHANYVTQPNFDKDNKDDKFNFYQRFRANFNFVANENLRAVVQLQFAGNGGDARWGGDGQHVAAGGVNRVDIRQAFLDFNIPNTEMNIRAGWQYWALPNTFGSLIWDFRAPAIIASSPINDMVGLTVGFSRLSDVNDSGFERGPAVGDDVKNSQDELDMFFAVLPVTMDGFEISPFVAWLRAGKYYGVDDAAGVAAFQPLSPGPRDLGLGLAYDDDWRAQNIFYLGFSATLDMFDPIVVHADFNYGHADRYYKGTLDTGLPSEEDASKLGAAAGWLALLGVEYKMDMVTPLLWGMYQSGESSSSFAPDKASKVMPNLGTGDLFPTSFATGGSQFGATSHYRLNLAAGAIGAMAIGLNLQDISFMDKLTHTARFVYYQGTNHSDHRDDGLFTTKDNAWEVNFDTSYQMYENLAAVLELGYINLSLSEDNDPRPDDDSFKAAAGFRYRF